jgi:hypothetical protein
MSSSRAPAVTDLDPAPPVVPAGHTWGAATVLVLTVATSFLLRFALASKESYWLDELYSVHLYAVQPASLAAAITSLAETSIHPPLYQVLLYGWIATFGDTEVATRTLSNLAVTAAVVALHRMVTRLHGRPTADVVAAGFAFSYLAVHFGLETRSYAQSLLLGVLSSYLLVRLLEPSLRPGRVVVGDPHPAADRVVVGVGWLGLLSLVNLLLLLTHYYNGFFWVAQGVAALVAVLVLVPAGRRLRAASRVVVAYGLQLAAFLALWGRVTLAAYRTYEGEYAVEAVSYSPVAMLTELVSPTVWIGPVPATLALAVAAALAIAGVRRRRDRGPAGTAASGVDETPTTAAFSVAYAVAMVVGPVLLAFGTFLVLQQERFVGRYLITVVPSILLLVVLAVREVVDGARRWAAPRLPAAWGRRLPRSPALLAVALVPLLLPGFVTAVTTPKVDWRGVAADVVAVTASDPANRYFVYETSSRRTPVLDHYLERHGGATRVDATLRRIDERHGRFPFRDDERLLAHDRILVVFTHHRTTDYPRTLAALEADFPVHHRQIDAEGQGYIVFEVPDD